MSAVKQKEYEFEYYEKYYGGKEEVLKTIEDCPHCESKLVITHFSDNGNLIVEETARCIECEYGQRKTIHVIN